MAGGTLQTVSIPSVTVAFVSLVGPYENWGKGLMELKEWLDDNGIPVTGQPIGLFYDNPTQSLPEELRSDACLPIEGVMDTEGRFQLKELPGGTAAAAKHIGPPSGYTRTYGAFLEGIINAGYLFEGPAREIFSEAREDLQPGMGVRTEQIVRKKE